MPKQGMAPHEGVELHEILTFKNICLTKSVTMSALVSDDELKSILQQDASTTERHIRELRGFLEDKDTDGHKGTDTITLS